MKTIKQKLLVCLVLLSMSINAQGIKTAMLSSYESPYGYYCPNSNFTDAYFDLTSANSQLLKGLNPNDYYVANYRENDMDDFGPMQPAYNYSACDGTVMYVTIYKSSDSQIYAYGRITLKVKKRPVPIYSYVQNNGGGDYFYSKSYFSSIPGMQYQGVSFKAHYAGVPNTIPVYRYFNPQYVDHFYTKTYMANGTAGYNSEGVEFYAYDYQYPGTVAVYRYFNSGLINHFYTTNFNLYGYSGSGYTYERVEFYAFPADFNTNKNASTDLKDELSVKEEKVNDLVAFPNPTTGLITIKSDSKIIDSVTVNNLFGEEVQIKNTSNSNTELDISNLPKGIYLVKVKSGDEEKVMRVIKE
jgi:Secretion system C-terminal sorting domain